MFSIIICTYNPDYTILEKLCITVEEFKTDQLIELIIIDNNSLIPVSENSVLKKMILRNKISIKIFTEPEPGLTAARIAGINFTQYEWIIFFDDDNLPDHEYLDQVLAMINQHENVGIWGPGQVKVKYLNGSDDFLESTKYIFQQRHNKDTAFARNSFWQSCYPYGTGMIVRRDIAKLYVSMVQQGKYTLTDRNKESMSSGGDVQIVLTGIKMGYYAGVGSGIKITHLINASKSTYSYILRLQYSTASAFIKAHNQVFPEKPIIPNYASNISILKMIYSCFRIYKKNLPQKHFNLLLAKRMGEVNAGILSNDQTKPLVLKIYEKIIHV
ncbi:MAG: glycosyltransferase family 2 protein [Flavobacterium sp.]|nr:MAG: glycosyltransferase family 2 protein [Flavobacterium sp.]